MTEHIALELTAEEASRRIAADIAPDRRCRLRGLIEALRRAIDGQDRSLGLLRL
jgi:hypothetical protein